MQHQQHFVFIFSSQVATSIRCSPPISRGSSTNDPAGDERKEEREDTGRGREGRRRGLFGSRQRMSDEERKSNHAPSSQRGHHVTPSESSSPESSSSQSSLSSPADRLSPRSSSVSFSYSSDCSVDCGGDGSATISSSNASSKQSPHVIM